jgi:hypothetical protein
MRIILAGRFRAGTLRWWSRLAVVGAQGDKRADPRARRGPAGDRFGLMLPSMISSTNGATLRPAITQGRHGR